MRLSSVPSLRLFVFVSTALFVAGAAIVWAGYAEDLSARLFAVRLDRVAARSVCADLPPGLVRLHCRERADRLPLSALRGIGRRRSPAGAALDFRSGQWRARHAASRARLETLRETLRELYSRQTAPSS